MRLTTLAVLAFAVAACSGSEPTAVQTDALIASAAEWTPAELMSGLDVDAATRERLEKGLQEMHAAMVEVHGRHEALAALDDDTREQRMQELHAAVRTVHEQHLELWNSLSPEVRAQLSERFHDRFGQHDEGMMESMHERLRRLHGR